MVCVPTTSTTSLRAGVVYYLMRRMRPVFDVKFHVVRELDVSPLSTLFAQLSRTYCCEQKK